MVGLVDILDAISVGDLPRARRATGKENRNAERIKRIVLGNGDREPDRERGVVAIGAVSCKAKIAIEHDFIRDVIFPICVSLCSGLARYNVERAVEVVCAGSYLGRREVERVGECRRVQDDVGQYSRGFRALWIRENGVKGTKETCPVCGSMP